jgi:DNA-binding MarR family transcriptional regulator
MDPVFSIPEHFPRPVCIDYPAVIKLVSIQIICILTTFFAMSSDDKNTGDRLPLVSCQDNPANTELHSSVLSLLRKITSTISRHSHQLTVDTGLTVPQLLCLRHIHQHHLLTPGTLASCLFISKATVTGILDRLENRGLVKRERNDPDRRKICLALTPEGEKLAMEAVWPLQEHFARNLAVLSENQCERIRETLSLIADMMEPASDYIVEKDEKSESI